MVWLFKGAFKVSSSAAQWDRSSYMVLSLMILKWQNLYFGGIGALDMFGFGGSPLQGPPT